VALQGLGAMLWKNIFSYVYCFDHWADSEQNCPCCHNKSFLLNCPWLKILQYQLCFKELARTASCAVCMEDQNSRAMALYSHPALGNWKSTELAIQEYHV